MNKKDLATAVVLCSPLIASGALGGLRLCGCIAWSWWAVTAPLWGTFLLTFMAVVIYATVLIYRYRHLIKRIF